MIDVFPDVRQAMTGLQLALHAADRIGLGPAPGDIERIRSLGYENFIEQQLQPDDIPQPDGLARRLAALPTWRMSAAELFRQHAPQAHKIAEGKPSPAERMALRKQMQHVAREAAVARMAQAVGSPAQLQETMTDFWFNHFNVFAQKDLDLVWVGAYEREAIRPHVFDRFETLLRATAKHPAMLFYLDNWMNTAPGSAGAHGRFDGINENYAREVMELHTLGVDGGYTQADVVALAHLLTGWGFTPGREAVREARLEKRDPRSSLGGFIFDPDRHDPSAQTLLGRTFDTGDADDGEAALTMLANHPATARHIAIKLCQYFVADKPEPALVAALSKTFLDTGGDTAAVLRTLFFSRSFREPTKFGTKFKTPYRFVVSAARASGVEVTNMRPLLATLIQLGQPLYGCQTPNGYAATEEAWLSPDALLKRINFAIALGAGRLPLTSADQTLDDNVPKTAAGGATPLDSDIVIAARGGVLAAKTRAAIATAPAPLKAGLVLGSPDFMRC